MEEFACIWVTDTDSLGAGSGDVNQDGIINILDVVQTMNIILSGGFEALADYNQDGLINVQDIVLIVNLILN
mgnify:CR=1 FL=1